MPTRTLGARVKLDGEAEYKKALSECANSNKLMSAELRKLAAEHKNDTDQTGYLTEANKVLNRQLEEQQKVTAATRKQLEEARSKYDENSAEVTKLKTALVNSETAEINFRNSIQENNEALTEATDKTSSFGDKVKGLADDLGIQLPAGAEKALGGLKGLSVGGAAAIGAIGAAVAGAVAEVKKLHQVTLEEASKIDEIITNSMVTGLSTKTLQELSYAENLIDVSAGTISGSLTKLTRNMASARDGNAGLTESFGRLGVEVTNADGSLRSAEDVFYEAIDALGQISNETERDALAMELFGKSAQELNPLILQGSGALRELAEEAENVGYVLDESQVKALGEVDDAYQRTQLQIEATRKKMAADFAPASVAAMEIAGNAVAAFSAGLKSSGVIEWLDSAIKGFGKLTGLYDEFASKTRADGVVDMGDGGGGWVRGSDGLYHSAGYGWNLPNATYDTASGRWYNSVTGTYYYADDQTIDPETGRARNGLLYDPEMDRFYDLVNHEWYGGTVAEAERQAELWRLESRLTRGRNAAGTDRWKGGLTWVGENGPEAVELPAGSRIYNAQESRHMGGDVFYITIEARTVKEFNDIIQMARDAQVVARMEG